MKLNIKLNFLDQLQGNMEWLNNTLSIEGSLSVLDTSTFNGTVLFSNNITMDNNGTLNVDRT